MEIEQRAPLTSATINARIHCRRSKRDNRGNLHPLLNVPVLSGSVRVADLVVLVVGLDEVLENAARLHEVDSLAVVEARVGQGGDTSVGVDLEEPSGNYQLLFPLLD